MWAARDSQRAGGPGRKDRRVVVGDISSGSWLSLSCPPTFSILSVPLPLLLALELTEVGPLDGCGPPMPGRLGKALSFSRLVGQGMGSWRLPLSSAFPVLLFLASFQASISWRLGASGLFRESLSRPKPMCSLPASRGGHRAVGSSSLAPPTPLRTSRGYPSLLSEAWGLPTFRPGLPSINSHLHTPVFLPHGTCMGRAVSLTCALLRGRLFPLGFGASRLLEFVLCSGDSIDPRGPSPMP